MNPKDSTKMIIKQLVYISDLTNCLSSSFPLKYNSHINQHQPVFVILLQKETGTVETDN